MEVGLLHSFITLSDDGRVLSPGLSDPPTATGVPHYPHPTTTQATGRAQVSHCCHALPCPLSPACVSSRCDLSPVSAGGHGARPRSAARCTAWSTGRCGARRAAGRRRASASSTDGAPPLPPSCTFCTRGAFAPPPAAPPDSGNGPPKALCTHTVPPPRSLSPLPCFPFENKLNPTIPPRSLPAGAGRGCLAAPSPLPTPVWGPPHGSDKLCPWLVGAQKRGCLFLLPGGSPSAQGRGGRLPPHPPGGFLLFVKSFLSLSRFGEPPPGRCPGKCLQECAHLH